MDYHTQTQAAGREILPDLVRAFAILGIVVVNVAAFGYPLLDGYGAAGLATTADKGAAFAVNSLALAKSYSLFSIMFGVGLFYQMRSAERAGVSARARYFRRMAGLLVLGVLHIWLAFIGDILVIYAITGCFLWLFRDSEVKSLRLTGTWILVAVIALSLLSAGILALIANVDPGFMEEFNDLMGLGDPEPLKTGNFIEAANYRVGTYLVLLQILASGQAILVLAYFLWGLALAKSGLIARPDAPEWGRARRIALPLGLAISVAGAAIMWGGSSQFEPRVALGMGIIMLGAPLSTLGYMGLLAKWAAGPRSALKTFMARGGTATLTAYLLQSAILSVVFTGYGFGKYGEMSAFPSVLLAFGVGLFTLAFTSLWRTRFPRGPMEWLLRKWTYGGDKRESAHSAAS